MVASKASRSTAPSKPTTTSTYQGSRLSSLSNLISYARPANNKRSPKTLTRKSRPRDEANLKSLQFLTREPSIVGGELYRGELTPVVHQEAYRQDT